MNTFNRHLPYLLENMETSKFLQRYEKSEDGTKSSWYKQYEKSNDGTKNSWYESSMVRNVHQWYEMSKVRKVYGTKSPAFLTALLLCSVILLPITRLYRVSEPHLSEYKSVKMKLLDMCDDSHHCYIWTDRQTNGQK